MVSLAGLLLVSVSVGLGNFATAIGIGIGGVDARTRLRLALVFGFFEAAMPVVGLLIGQGLAGPVGAIGHYAGAGLLVFTGAYALWQAWRERQEVGESRAERLGNRQVGLGRLLLTGLALSIDNLVIGFALSFSNVPLALAAVVIGAVSVGLSLMGLELGRFFGRRIEEWSEFFSGAILILVGLAIGFGLF
jgi:manganese efflux pump family protein